MKSIVGVCFFLLLTACGAKRTDSADQGCATWVDEQNGNTLNYCVREIGEKNEGGQTLFAFHGLGASPSSICARLSAYLGSLATENSIARVVCPSFGPHFVIHKKDRINTFFRLQSKLSSENQSNTKLMHLLYGESMGGFNALKLSAENSTGELQFQKVVVACPAIFSVKHPLRALAKLVPGSIFGNFNRETSIAIIQDSPYFDRDKFFPTMAIFANREDQTGRLTIGKAEMPLGHIGGIWDGAKDFYHLRKKMGDSIAFTELNGGHCSGLPMDQVIRFLVF